MKASLENHLSKLYVYPSRSAYMLSSDTDMRAYCKRMRERLKRLLPSIEYHAVWLRQEDGVLLVVAGPRVLASILSGMFEESERLYSGAGRNVSRYFIRHALESRYVYVGKRSFGASRS